MKHCDNDIWPSRPVAHGVVKYSTTDQKEKEEPVFGVVKEHEESNITNLQSIH